ncbi:MAG: indolepyruvate oxidoreductase subunit beta [Salinivirgaceae bacterium]|jgi:indolepyruvate ferredoxin oxidoreductase beta subunit|nr:indolepyruvate oxidoreductase subunit beta [Salinivirgaceae bacterium]
MKTDIILAGVGGQGILSIASVIGIAALKNTLQVKQSETHGMSQRGGAVLSHMRISDKPIYSDLIPKGEADLILSVEPMESLRYLPFLAKEGYIVTNTAPFLNIPNYPQLDEVLKKLNTLERTVLFNADELAANIGSKLASNMVILGAATPFLNHINYESIQNGIVELFSKKGDDIININLMALQIGMEIANKVLD